jgi:hypothetical protein
MESRKNIEPLAKKSVSQIIGVIKDFTIYDAIL